MKRFMASKTEEAKKANVLPVEVWLHVFGFLQSVEDLCALSLVSKSFHSIASDDSLWSVLSCPTWRPLEGETYKERYLKHLRKAIADQPHRQKTPKNSSFKVILLGPSGVGKTSIMNYLIRGVDYSEATIGAAFKAKTITIGDKSYKLELWDTAGQERFVGHMAPMYYRNAQGAILVADLHDSPTFNKALAWLAEMRRTVKGIPVIFAANKCDLPVDPKWPGPEGTDLPYMETSAKTGYNIHRLFTQLTHLIISPPVLWWEEGEPNHTPSKEALERHGVSFEPPPTGIQIKPEKAPEAVSQCYC